MRPPLLGACKRFRMRQPMAALFRILSAFYGIMVSVDPGGGCFARLKPDGTEEWR